MVAKSKTIEVELGSETAHLLDEADRSPLVLVVGGSRYRVQREAEDVERSPGIDTAVSENELGPGWENYDPERVIRVLEEMAGTWADRDIDGMIDAVYRARREGTRRPNRPNRPGPL